MTTIETIILAVALTSTLAPFPWYVALPDDVEEKLTEKDKQGLISFIAGLGLLAIAYLTGTDTWHLVYKTTTLTGVVATATAAWGGLLVGSGGIVMLPNHISRLLLKQKNLKWYALTVAVVATALIFIF